MALSPTILRVVERLELAIGIDGTPRSLTEAIETVLLTTFNLSAAGAAERAEDLSEPVARRLSEQVFQLDRRGLTSTLVVLGSQNDVVAGSSHILPGDDVIVTQVKKHRVYSHPLLSAMRSLTADDFELFGAKVLKELGAVNPRVTRQSGDQGIDFYGEISVGGLQGLPASFFRLAHDARFYFAGQAKHYPDSNIGPGILRELVGAVSLARTKTYSDKTIDLFEGTTIKPFSPMLALLFTTGGLSSGAVELAEAAGVIARSGAQLALFLADRGVGMEDNGMGLSFSPAAFAAWLQSG